MGCCGSRRQRHLLRKGCRRLAEPQARLAAKPKKGSFFRAKAGAGRTLDTKTAGSSEVFWPDFRGFFFRELKMSEQILHQKLPKKRSTKRSTTFCTRSSTKRSTTFCTRSCKKGAHKGAQHFAPEVAQKGAQHFAPEVAKKEHKKEHNILNQKQHKKEHNKLHQKLQNRSTKRSTTLCTRSGPSFGSISRWKPKLAQRADIPKLLFLIVNSTRSSTTFCTRSSRKSSKTFCTRSCKKGTQKGAQHFAPK